jgi:glucan phosphorylase
VTASSIIPAYVCAEIHTHVSELGIQAGDDLKSASDRGVPLVAIGLVYRRVFVAHEVEEDGQFRIIEADHDPGDPGDPDTAALERVLGPDGAPLSVTVTCMDQPVQIGVWSRAVGDVRRLLLDTDAAQNSAEIRELCTRACSPGSAVRARQDALLAVASEPVLQAMGISARVVHRVGDGTPREHSDVRVHLPTWTAKDVVDTLEIDGPRICGADFVERIDKLKPRTLWNLRARARERMVERLYARGLPAGDSDALWIGCAGRLGAGLRTDLLFDDLARLGRLLDDPINAVRLVVSGAADADDVAGQAQLAKLAALSQDPRFEGRIIFVPDWGLEVAHILVEGVDLWLGTGTRGRASESWGIRAAANGALNLSIAQGWWREVASDEEPQLGWTLGGERTFDDQAAQDASDSRMLFALLETQIVPSFYDWDGEAIPQRWVDRIRASMRLIPVAFDGDRLLRGAL